MSDAKIPAGWYPDPKDTTTTPRPERWWDGTGWTTTTRPGPGAPHPAQDPDGEPTTVLEGTVPADDGTVRYPEPPTGFADGTDHPGAGADHLSGYPDAPKKPSLLSRIGRRTLVAAAVAGVLGLAIGSGATYLAVGHHNHDRRQAAAPAPQNTYPGPGHHRGPGNGGGTGGGQGNGNGNGNGNGQGGGRGNGNGPGGGGIPGLPGIPGLGGGLPGLGDGTQAIDMADGISLPIPSGWQGGTAKDGTASLYIGQYQCPGSSANSSTSCTLGGVNTAQVDGTDPKAAATQDIQKVAAQSYGPNIKGHQELKSEPVTVAGRSGYLIRWQVDAQQGNNGTVQDVVFPTADGKHLVAVQFGFDIADKAPAVSTMDTIVSGIKDFSGSGAGSLGGATGGSNT
ncbi:DUF2510 domain-containing protein [Kitasatospora sp. RB6PN24]|uniref:DUF2510 domain-containing protein n=1 Tax=Kitasatospora humi TaxID=2893891 RepID=UPI001E3DB3E4|nr:DUF2510 domain-containing protein [Kitasatospora humi]MCC9307460.1 DUF2510 domain-containing protein [Kitasatospora humi]